ncbi:MAG TPA: succinate-semialdehyde dehydrogenase [Deltaproteobacteria bacterium]|nr:succinate-semialdehyde dehydrogenase [Deltaproteobacteria bacterium]HCP45905.1 succinate-semialdehyde dehydrogenase [Deltaproteobacteria bacterium]
MTAPQKFTDTGRMRAINPRTWEVLAELEPMPTAHLTTAITTCRHAQKLWSAQSLKSRCHALQEVMHRVVERGDELALAVRREQGKSTAEAYFSEVMGAATTIQTHLKYDPKWLKSKRVAIDPLSYPGKRGRVERRPRGLIGLITPWNYPLALPMRTIVPALLAGNGVLFKPSEHSMLVAEAIGDLFQDVLPEGLLQVLQGGGELGAALAQSPALDALVFTGSVTTGREVARAAAANLCPLSLELGGKDAAIVCVDADLDRSAAGIAWAAFHNTGQNCAAVERVYVEDSVHDAFVQRLIEATNQLRTEGDPELVEVGPLCNQRQFDLVQRQVEEAVARGARVLAGGKPTGEGWGFQPTLLADVPDDCSIWHEETFGPVLPIARVHSVYEAVDRTNASPFGLSASIWGQDLGRAESLGRRCEVGMALVNNHAFTGSIANAPWVGTKESGTGVTGSELALGFLTRPQLVVLDKSRVKEVWWFPLNPAALALARTLLASLVAPIGKRISLLVRLLGLLSRRWK